MPAREETPIPATDYLRDAIDHIEKVTRSVKKAIDGMRATRSPRTVELKFFGRGCSVKADRLPWPFGGGCSKGPPSLRELKATRAARSRRGR